MKKTISIYNGGGYLYDDGDVPNCEYCGTSAEDTSIFATAHSGILICDEQSCISEYAMNNILCDRLEEETKEIKVCDRCEGEVTVDDYFHKNSDGEEFCDCCKTNEDKII